MSGTACVFDSSSSTSSWICLPSIPPLLLASPTASLMAFEAEVPKAEVAPVSDRNAPILMLSDRDSGIEHAENSRQMAIRSRDVLLIWESSLQDYRNFRINRRLCL